MSEEDENVPPTAPPRPIMKVSWQTMNENYVPLHLRDYCAHELIPLTALESFSSSLPLPLFFLFFFLNFFFFF